MFNSGKSSSVTRWLLLALFVVGALAVYIRSYSSGDTLSCHLSGRRHEYSAERDYSVTAYRGSICVCYEAADAPEEFSKDPYVSNSRRVFWHTAEGYGVVSSTSGSDATAEFSKYRTFIGFGYFSATPNETTVVGAFIPCWGMMLCAGYLLLWKCRRLLSRNRFDLGYGRRGSGFEVIADGQHATKERCQRRDVCL
jgi:hypothetical protein